MNIKLGMPYKIVAIRTKRYAAHYNIAPERSLVVPLRLFGEEVSCDIRWEDDNGELHLLQEKIFVSANLEPLNPMIDSKLHELWQHYYAGNKTAAVADPHSAPSEPASS